MGALDDGIVQSPQNATPSMLPLGRKSPKGTLRWYLAACPPGREQATCEKTLAIIPSELLEEAFVPRMEMQKKFHGEWRTFVTSLLRVDGYFIVVTKDASGLSRALAKLTFPVQLVGAVGRGYAPISKDAQTFLGEAMDSSHIVRLSWGEIVDDELHVTSGPLLACEPRITRINRRKSLALVRLEGDSTGEEFTILMPLAIPTRR